MNAKTYGQDLFEALGGTNWDRLNNTTRNLFEKDATAAILIFIKRVEERSDEIYNELKFDPRFDNNLEWAFKELSTELKEAK